VVIFVLGGAESSGLSVVDLVTVCVMTTCALMWCRTKLQKRMASEWLI